jgi:hypothetical protein
VNDRISFFQNYSDGFINPILLEIAYFLVGQKINFAQKSALTIILLNTRI